MDLPDHIWMQAFANLDNNSKYNVALTCKKFNEIVKASPRIYKTFKLNFSGPRKIQQKELPTLTRPIPTVIFQKTKLNPQIYPSILRFFEKNGKYVKKICLKYLVLDFEMLMELLNLIPNAEYLHISISFGNKIFGTDNHCDRVKNRFLKLKSLKLFFKDTKSFPVEVFYKFFRDCKEISVLGLSHCFNLLYNKPKLEKLFLTFETEEDYGMDSASESNKILGNIKEIWLEVHQFKLQLETWKILEKFVTSQKKIEKVTFAQLSGNGYSFRNIIQHVSQLASLKEFEIFDTNVENIENFFSTCQSVHYLKIDRYPQHFLVYFPNLKSLKIEDVTYASDDIQAINQLSSLEELSIHFFKSDYSQLKLTNLKKLVFKESVVIEQGVADTITKNNPNIIDFTLDMPCPVSYSTMQYQMTILKNLKHLKRYACMPIFYRLADAEKFLKIFSDHAKSLVHLEFHLREFDLEKEFIQYAVNYFAKYMPNLKFEYFHDMENYNWEISHFQKDYVDKFD